MSVELYDMAGSRVGRYDAGYREAGQVHLTMSPKGLPSGPYLVAVSCAGTRVASSIVHLLW